MRTLEIVCAVCLAVIAAAILASGLFTFSLKGDTSTLPQWLVALAVPVAAIAWVLRRVRNRNSDPPPPLVALLAFIACGFQVGCGGAAELGCAVWDTSHRTACEMCERTEGPCPFGPHAPPEAADAGAPNASPAAE